MSRSAFLVALLIPLAAATAAPAKPAPNALPKGLPPALQQRLRAHPPPQGFRVDASARPLFLRGDFDGAGKTGYAVVLAPRTTGHEDVLVYLADGRPRLLSRDLGGRVWPGPEWKFFPKRERVPERPDINEEMNPRAEPHPTLVGDGIEFAKPQSSSALVYWGKGRFHIYWLSD